jgi:hypothetical protein
MLSEHVTVSPVVLCNFLHRLKITRKKRLSALPNNIGKMSSTSVPNGKSCKRFSTLQHSSSSTTLGRKRT